MKKLSTTLLLILLSSSLAIAGGKYKKSFNYNRHHNINLSLFKTGDIILQHTPGRLASVIKDVTHSKYSHCGIVVLRRHKLYVLEAIGPVRYTPLQDWIKQGGGKYTLMRPKNLSSTQIDQAISEAQKLIGKPYDMQYELDEQKIYCSELVYKAYLRGCKVELGKQEKLGDLNWKPHEAFIRHLAGGILPLDRLMVTPESVSKDADLSMVYTNFLPTNRLQFTPKYNLLSVAGKWEGEYSIRHTVIQIKLDVNKHGKLNDGKFIFPGGREFKINALNIQQGHQSHQFFGTIHDQRGVKADISFSLSDRGQRLIGTWKDNYKHIGNFSLQKQVTKVQRPHLISTLPTPQTPSPSTNSLDVFEKLKKLQELKKLEIISEEEYEKIRSRLLSDIR